MKLRLHELAGELGLPPQRVVELLRAMNVRVKGPSSAVDDQDADVLRQTLRADPSLRIGRRPESWRVAAATYPTPQSSDWSRFERSGFATLAEWAAAQDVLAVNGASRRAAAAKSQAIWEANLRNRRRGGTPTDQPAPRAERRYTFVQGGAPGLGKRR
jgi:hypothetical protein